MGDDIEIEQESEGIDCCPCLAEQRIRRSLISIALGQVMSFALSTTAVSSEYLAKYNVNTPTTQSFLNYLLLSFVYGTMIACKEQSDLNLVTIVRERGWKYAIVAFFDVEANFCIVMAFQYSNLTSIQVLDCFTIPVVLILSWLCMHVRYLITHIIGVAICLMGVACLIWADVLVQKDGNEGGSNRLVGDMLALCGATLYGVSNVCEEYFVKSYNRVEYLGMIGLFGSIISGLQLSLIERTAISQIDWANVLMYILFALSMFAFYSLVSVVMQRTSAAMFNLAILSSDFYSLIFGIALFQYKFHLLYFASFFCVIIGSIIYTLKDTHRTNDRADDANRLESEPATVVRQSDGAIILLDPKRTTYNSTTNNGPPDCICCTSNNNCCNDNDDETEEYTMEVQPISNGLLPGTDQSVHVCPVHGPRQQAMPQSMQSSVSYQHYIPPAPPSQLSSTSGSAGRSAPLPPPRTSSINDSTPILHFAHNSRVHNTISLDDQRLRESIA